MIEAPPARDAGDRTRTSRWAGYAWLLPVLAAAFLAGQAVRPLTDTSEGRFAEIAREMLASGDWFIPTLNHVPHIVKPPLVNWLMAGSMAVFGVNEWGARFAGFAAFALTVALVGRLARVLGRPEASGWAALLYGCSAGPLTAATFPTTDTILTFFETAAALAYLEHRRGSLVARWFFFAAAGAAFLTKGPPALLVPAAVVIGDRLLRPRSATEGRRPLFRFGRGWALFAVLGLGWYLAVVAVHPRVLGYWLHYEVVDRIFTSHFGRNQSPLIYLYGFAGGLFPWWFLFPGFFKRRWHGLRHEWRGEAGRVLLAWFVLPLVVFTISQSRLVLYVLPLFPALVLALALDRPRRLREVPGRWFGLRPGFLLGYAALWVVVSWISVPAAGGSSWKGEAARLRVALPPVPTELVLLRWDRLSSIAFYLKTPGEIVSLEDGDRREPWDSLAEEMAEMRDTPEGEAAHLFVTHTGSEAERFRARIQPPVREVGRHARYTVWYQPPLRPGKPPELPPDQGMARDRPVFVTFEPRTAMFGFE
jgi:4-amino-4-deoxy-L-arabinose transferase-like glycosyltransferase